MAKDDQNLEAQKAGQSPSEVENLKEHDQASAESREVRAAELTVAPRRVSDETLRAMEAASELTIAATEDTKYDGTSVKGATIGAASGGSRDSADYEYRDVLGTTIVGYQEQVPKGS